MREQLDAVVRSRIDRLSWVSPMKITRRQAIKLAGAAPLASLACRAPRISDGPTVLNDIHSKLNPTTVARVVRPTDLEQLKQTVVSAVSGEQSISIAGGRHAMGGQQFGSDTLNLDLRGLNRVLRFDPVDGIVEVESGIEWPKLIEWCVAKQEGADHQWGIRQKQTGADRLTLGGALAANAHGRGLAMPPMVGEIESFTLIDGKGGLVGFRLGAGQVVPGIGTYLARFLFAPAAGRES